MELGRGFGRERASGEISLPPVNRSTAIALNSQVGSSQYQEVIGWVLGPFKMKRSQAYLPRRRNEEENAPTAAHSGGGRRRTLGREKRERKGSVVAAARVGVSRFRVC